MNEFEYQDVFFEDVMENYYSTESDIYRDTIDMEEVCINNDDTVFYDTIETEEDDLDFLKFQNTEIWIERCGDKGKDPSHSDIPDSIPWYAQLFFILWGLASLGFVLTVLWIFMCMK